MGAKAKKAMKKQLSKASAQLSASSHKKREAAATASVTVTASTAADFLVVQLVSSPRKSPMRMLLQFYTLVGYLTASMRRRWKTGKSKHFGFIEFADPEVAKVVADTMHNYLLFEHVLHVHLIPPQKVHLKLWKGFNFRVRPVNWVQIERKRHDKERTVEELKKFMEKIMKRDLKRQKKIEAAGIDYKCPEIEGGGEEPAPKKRKTDQKKVVSK
ncbi:uncharacterized protein LOC126603428 isoform X2 [Malus sylvestris]|uniref:uncharacterized protein LOC126603428 isoform X2 n=1 Tax=Malus sylvestris TaxID=3752 RepID=UPI0021ABBA3A|nr:uncharacterized protein LOC126603428 isoform X2 [Malus sylvestris]